MRAVLLVFACIIDVLSALALANLSTITTPETTTNVSNCTAKYGDQPAARTDSIDGLLIIFNVCGNISSWSTSGSLELLLFTDSNGQQRYACFLIKPSSKPLPLLVWLHPSLAPASAIFLTNLTLDSDTANLTGTSNGSLGYHLLLPFGRDTVHIYPLPDNEGLGWDNWYRNYNRSDPALNVDVETIDYFIKQVVLNQSSTFHIDPSRVYMSGWSNGASMAVEYALNTPGIAAVAAYAAPDPYRDYKDPCAQVPYPSSFTPILILYNQCDVIGICMTGNAFIKDLSIRYNNTLIAKAITIDLFLNPTMTCDINCTNIYPGYTQHMRWPMTLNDKVFFNFFRQYSLY
jgi:predicted esterase